MFTGINNILYFIQRTTVEAKFNQYFQFSSTALFKYQVFFSRMMFNDIERQRTFSKNELLYPDSLKLTKDFTYLGNILKLILFSFSFYLQTFISYFFIRIIYRLNRLPVISSHTDSFSKFRYIGIITPHGVPKFKMLDTIFPSEKTELVYMYTNQMFLPIKKKKKYAPEGFNPFFLCPVLIPFNIFFRMLSYCLTSGIYSYSACNRLLMVNGLNSNISVEIQKLILKTFLYQYWGKIVSKRLTQFFPEAVFFFEDDFIGKQLNLVEELNKLQKQTVQIQHGTMTDARYYFPLCKWMLCCSEREKKLLIQSGIEENRLFIMGAPLQTLPGHATLIHPSNFEMLILAGQGNHALQHFYTQMLIQSKRIQSCKNGLLRAHPVFTPGEKTAWMNSVPNFKVIPHSFLTQDITQSELIITFSLDAMIQCLWKKKKTILCYDPADDSLNFLKEIPFFKIAVQREELDKAIFEFNNIPEPMNAPLINEQLMEQFFGTSDLSKIKSNVAQFLHFLNSTLSPQ